MYELTVPSEGRLKRRDACIPKLDTQSLNGLTNLGDFDSGLEELCSCSALEDGTCSALVAEIIRSWGEWDSRSGEMELLGESLSDDTRSISTRTRFKMLVLDFQ